MNAIERKTAISLALIYATRMLGLFMILPVSVVISEVELRTMVYS